MWTIFDRRPVFSPVPPFFSGRYYNSQVPTAFGTTAMTKDILYASPIFVPFRTAFTSIAVEVTAFVAGSNVRLGVYYDSGGQPGALVFDAGAVTTDTPNQARQIVIAQTLEAGWYWLAADFSHTPTMRSNTQSASLGYILGYLTNVDVTNHVGWSVAQAYGALPNPFTAGGALMAGACPRVMLGV